MPEKIIIGKDRGFASSTNLRDQKIRDQAYLDSIGNGHISPEKHYFDAEEKLYPHGFVPTAVITSRDIVKARRLGGNAILWEADTQTVRLAHPAVEAFEGLKTDERT